MSNSERQPIHELCRTVGLRNLNIFRCPVGDIQNEDYKSDENYLHSYIYNEKMLVIIYKK